MTSLSTACASTAPGSTALAATACVSASGVDPSPLRAFVDSGVSGLILMADNVPGSPAELAAITAALHSDPDAPVLVGIDEEGGEVQRLPWDGAASAEVLRGVPADAARNAVDHIHARYESVNKGRIRVVDGKIQQDQGRDGQI